MGSSGSQEGAAACQPALKRLLIDYDSTLNPGQGNLPLTSERAKLLEAYLTKWQKLGLEIFVLTSSNPEKKEKALEAAGIRGLFTDVLSSTMPRRFPTKGDFIAKRIREDGWIPSEQLLADDSIEAVQSIFQDADAAPRAAGPLAHTWRLPQHSSTGLLEEDLRLLDAKVAGSPGSGDGGATTHCYSFQHDGQQVDASDSAEKCMLDSLPLDTRIQVLKANSPERRQEWIASRPDFAALCAAAGPEVEAPAAPAKQAAPPPSDATQPQALLEGSLLSGQSALPAKGAGKGAGKSGFFPPSRAAATTGAASSTSRAEIDLHRLEALTKRLEAAAAAAVLVPPTSTANGDCPRPSTAAPRPPDVAIDLSVLDAVVGRVERAASLL
eukprot:CAMPEP_0170651258 /NCGR_PEP_ID=MMETSP0224-20130122/46280_1 /TAXON_ID=285029 /ORGANISM="Togula jolla, Strain CCCM 725" /LENGTH=382 /DNA_ID=CAMNT_0010983055 /DNA_START=14 /DNA_END=1160 /DNA_ORIENTATION=+